MLIVGVDGLVQAGKTTLIQRLSSTLDAAVIEEYGVYIKKDGANFPPFPPSSCEEAQEATRCFVEIECRRLRDMKHFNQKRVALVDRTYLSCLAFDYAVQKMTGLEVISSAKRLWANNQKIEPDLICFLDVSHSHLERRIAPHKHKFLPHFYNEEFNQYMTEFFNRVCRDNRCMVQFDADNDPQSISTQVLTCICNLCES